MRRHLSLVLLCACAHSPTTTAPATQPQAASRPAAPRTIDEGHFVVQLTGRAIGEETFSIRADGDHREIRSDTTVNFGDQDMRSAGVLTTDAGWQPEAARFDRAAGAKTEVLAIARRPDGVLAAKRGEVETAEKTHSDLYIGDLSFIHLAALCALSGDKRKELSVFPGVTMVMGSHAPLGLAAVAARNLVFVPALIGGKTAVETVCDGGKLVLARYSDFGITIVRDGYDDVLAAIRRAESRKPEPPAGIADVPRRVHSDADGGAILACSLMIPEAHPAPLPAVIFLTDVGPEDRDDDTVGAGGVKMALFKYLAIGLAQQGIASLRCDDRGVADSTGSLATATLETFVADAEAQLAALRAEPGIDLARIGVVGHAEGGVVAPMVAEKDKELKALALLAPFGRSLDQITLTDHDADLRRAGYKDDFIAKEHKRLDGIYAAIRTGKPLPPSTSVEERKILTPALPYLSSHFRHDPAKTLGRSRLPVLIAHGGKDFQVSQKDDAERLRTALTRGGNKRVAFKVYPELGHFFAPAPSGTPADYADPENHIDPGFIQDFVGFVKASL